MSLHTKHQNCGIINQMFETGKGAIYDGTGNQKTD